VTFQFRVEVLELGRGKTGGRKKPRLDIHRPIRDRAYGRVPGIDPHALCPMCLGKHTLNEHRFHGKGAFCRTHKKAPTCRSF